MWKKIGISLGIAGGVILCIGLTPIFLGFGVGGIVAGSAAAAIQAGIGNVVAGSAFATFTSLGMTGVLSGISIAGGLLGTTGLFILSWKNTYKEFKTLVASSTENFAKSTMMITEKIAEESKPFINNTIKQTSVISKKVVQSSTIITKNLVTQSKPFVKNTISKSKTFSENVIKSTQHLAIKSKPFIDNAILSSKGFTQNLFKSSVNLTNNIAKETKPFFKNTINRTKTFGEQFLNYFK